MDDSGLEAKALEAFRNTLDYYQWQMDSVEERFQRFSSILKLFTNPRLLSAASAALHAPRFQLLLIVRGLEIAQPFPSSERNLAQWCNDRLAELDASSLEPVDSLIGYAAWSAYAPAQSREIQNRHYSKLVHVGKAVVTGPSLNDADKALLELLNKLFPRVGEVIRSKLSSY